jgi:hypothetical protein
LYGRRLAGKAGKKEVNLVKIGKTCLTRGGQLSILERKETFMD